MTLMLLIVIILGLIAALYDFMFYKIPNKIVFALCILSVPYLVFFAPEGTLILTLSLSFILLALGFMCNRFGWMGAGDAKLLAVASLWVVPPHIPAMILVMALIGGFLALVFMTMASQIDIFRIRLIAATRPLMSRISGLSDYYNAEFIPSQAEERSKTPIPYGVAIALALVYICLIKIGALS